MLEYIPNFYKRETPVIIPRWGDYLGELAYQKHLLTKRFINDSPKSATSVMFLKNIISQIDMNYLHRLNNDYDRYSLYFRQQSKVLNELFDPVRTGRAYSNLFYNTKNKKTLEYLCPVEDIASVRLYPYSNNRYDVWSSVEPVTMWYNNSFEYSLNIQNDKITYKNSSPDYSVIFIDTTILGMKYYKYMTQCDEDVKNEFTFIHRHVLNKFFDHLQDTWILNQILSVINSVYYDKPIEDIITDRQFGYLGSRHRDGLEHLRRKVEEIRDNKISPQRFMSSTLFPSGESIRDKIIYSLDYLDVFTLTQYQYMELLKELPYLDIVIKLHALRPKDMETNTLAKLLRVRIQKLINNKISNRINNKEVRYQISSYIEDLNNTILNILKY